MSSIETSAHLILRRTERVPYWNGTLQN